MAVAAGMALLSTATGVAGGTITAATATAAATGLGAGIFGGATLFVSTSLTPREQSSRLIGRWTATRQGSPRYAV